MRWNWRARRTDWRSSCYLEWARLRKGCHGFSLVSQWHGEIHHGVWRRNTEPVMVPPSGEWWRKSKVVSKPSTVASSLLREDRAVCSTCFRGLHENGDWWGPGPTSPPLLSRSRRPPEAWRNWRTRRSVANWDIPSLQHMGWLMEQQKCNPRTECAAQWWTWDPT